MAPSRRGSPDEDRAEIAIIEIAVPAAMPQATAAALRADRPRRGRLRSGTEGGGLTDDRSGADAADRLPAQRRALPGLLGTLVVVGIIYGGGESEAAEAYGFSAVALFPVIAWQAKLLLDTEPDVQRRLAVSAVGPAPGGHRRPRSPPASSAWSPSPWRWRCPGWSAGSKGRAASCLGLWAHAAAPGRRRRPRRAGQPADHQIDALRHRRAGHRLGAGDRPGPRQLRGALARAAADGRRPNTWPDQPGSATIAALDRPGRALDGRGGARSTPGCGVPEADLGFGVELPRRRNLNCEVPPETAGHRAGRRGRRPRIAGGPRRLNGS